MSSPHNLILRFDNHILCRLNPSQDLLIFTMYFHSPLPFSYLVMLAGFHGPIKDISLRSVHLEKWRMKGNLSQMKKGKVNFLVKGRLLKNTFGDATGERAPRLARLVKLRREAKGDLGILFLDRLPFGVFGMRLDDDV